MVLPGTPARTDRRDQAIGGVAAQKAKAGELLANATVENVRRQVARLKTAAPLIAEALRAKKIDIVGGMYDIATGKVTML